MSVLKEQLSDLISTVSADSNNLMDNASKVFQLLESSELIPALIDQESESEYRTCLAEINSKKMNSDVSEKCLRVIAGLKQVGFQIYKVQHNFSLMCLYLHKATGASHSQIAKLVEKLTGDSHSKSKITKSIHNGNLLEEFPQLKDIKDETKLLAISQLPSELKARVAESGEINGINIRESTRKAVANAVKTTKTKNDEKVPTGATSKNADAADSAIDQLAEQIRALLDLNLSVEQQAAIKLPAQQLLKAITKYLKQDTSRKVNNG